MGSERILIIDNKTETNSFLAGLLEPLGYQLATACNGRAGLQMALAEPPDLLLLDLNVQGVPGIKVLEALRRHDFPSPVILMACPGSEEMLVRALRLGVRDYILKPIDINELIVSIDWALAEGRLRCERERLLSELQVVNDRLRQRMVDLVTLQEVGRFVASAIPRGEVLHRILDAAFYLTDADASMVFLVDPEGGALRLEAVRHAQGYAYGLAQPVVDENAVEVLRACRPIRLSCASRPGDLADHFGIGAHSLLYVPMRSGEAVAGVLGVAALPRRILGAIEAMNKVDPGAPGSCHTFTPEDEELLEGVAAFAALAIENARLHAAVRETVAAETLHEAAVTLSHHVNNPLQALMGAAERLRCEAEDLAAQTLAGKAPAVHIAELIEEKALEISIVLSILEDLSVLENKSYLGTLQMINIEQELRQRMAADRQGKPFR